jgi:dienelactone hydrolase
MNSHQVVDVVEGWIRSRQEQAPVESTVGDLDRFLDVDPREVHPEVEPADLVLDSPERTRSLMGRLPPSRLPRIERSFEFQSPVESPHSANDTVHGVRWHGEGHDSASAAVVMLHGAFAPSFSAERILSTPLLRRDVHCFAMAEPYHMQRAPDASEYSGQYLLSGDVPRFVDGLVQAVADVRTLVVTLREEGYDRIFLSGISLGGNVVGQAVTMADVDGATLAIPAVDLGETLGRAPIAKGIRRAARRAGFSEPDVREAMRVVTPRLLGSPVPDPSDLYVVYGRWDRQAPPEPIEALLREWEGVTAMRYPAGHRTMGLRIFELRHQMAGWIDAKLPTGDA